MCLVERSRLLKEVWEDEGVIVTRSLDMFISKLRKKLEGDPGIKLVNVHGKGYRLEVAPTNKSIAVSRRNYNSAICQY